MSLQKINKSFYTENAMNLILKDIKDRINRENESIIFINITHFFSHLHFYFAFAMFCHKKIII